MSRLIKQNYHPYELADILACSKRTVYRLMENKWIRANHNTRPRKIPRSAIWSMLKEDDQLLRPRDIAQKLKVSRGTIYRWFYEGRLDGVKLNKTLRIWATSVEKLVQNSEEGLQ